MPHYVWSGAYYYCKISFLILWFYFATLLLKRETTSLNIFNAAKNSSRKVAKAQSYDHKKT